MLWCYSRYFRQKIAISIELVVKLHCCIHQTLGSCHTGSTRTWYVFPLLFFFRACLHRTSSSRRHPLDGMLSVHETPDQWCASHSVSRARIHKAASTKRLLYNVWVNNPLTLKINCIHGDLGVLRMNIFWNYIVLHDITFCLLAKINK